MVLGVAQSRIVVLAKNIGAKLLEWECTSQSTSFVNKWLSCHATIPILGSSTTVSVQTHAWLVFASMHLDGVSKW